jgi:hypothetical protein
MDELIKLVSSKVGISPDQAEQAVQTVLGFLKDKLPAGLGSQLEGLIGGDKKEGESASGGAMDAVGDALGGLFGKK